MPFKWDWIQKFELFLFFDWSTWNSRQFSKIFVFVIDRGCLSKIRGQVKAANFTLTSSWMYISTKIPSQDGRVFIFLWIFLFFVYTSFLFNFFFLFSCFSLVFLLILVLFLFWVGGGRFRSRIDFISVWFIYQEAINDRFFVSAFPFPGYLMDCLMRKFRVSYYY